MNIVTVNVGQGALAIVRHNGEAIIVDSRIPMKGHRHHAALYPDVPDVLLLSQLADRQRRLPAEPERRLLVAMFEDAVALLRRGPRRGASSSCGAQWERNGDFKDTVTWITAGVSDWPYNFVAVCHWLDLNPAAARVTLLAMAAKHLAQPAAADPLGVEYRRWKERRQLQ